MKCKPQLSARPEGRQRKMSIADTIEIARASRFRVRPILLRGEWWKQDAGPLLAWYGPQRSPVALIPSSRQRYAMIEPRSGTRRLVDRSLADEIDPKAVTFYPALPPGPLRFRDLLAFSLRQSRGNGLQILLSVGLLGLLSLVFPLITQALVDPVIPRTELDQLAFCALALAVTAIARIAGVQTVESCGDVPGSRA